MKTEPRVTSLTTGKVLMRTKPTTSLHQRSTLEGVIGMTATCVMSSVIEMHATILKTGVENKSVWNRNSATRGTMITMVPTMTNLTVALP
jgi:hypothetical protein